MRPLHVRLVCAAAVFLTSAAGIPAPPDTALAPGDLVPAALAVDAQPNGTSSDGNRVLEAGEAVVVAPSWRNTTAAPIAATGAASAFGGPGAAALYTLTDASASYAIPAGQTASCAAGGDCFAVALGVPAPRPEPHWDATFGETTSTGSVKTWMLHVGESYADVPRSNIFYRFIETLLHHGVGGGCPAGSYCPTAPMTRDWMAAFVLGSRDGRYYAPPACTLGTELFADMPATNPLCRWVEELARRGVVMGCGGGSYCPTHVVSREQMAVFILVTREGNAYAPPPCVAGAERFADVPASSPFCRWIEELARRNVVTGCGSGNYCPTQAVSREQMSVFLSVTFGLALYGAPPPMYLVNTTNDADDGACTPAHCSLREAITAANVTANPAGAREEIHFRIPGAGPHSINPATALPAISDAAVVDAYTQPGARPNTLGFGNGLDSVLRIELDLSSAGPLVIATSSSLLRGLAINRSPSAGVHLGGASNAIEGCYIGTDATGTVDLGNGSNGITILEFRNQNRVGGTLPVHRNLISGNGSSGVGIESANQNLIQGNLIGTNRAGSGALANAGFGVSAVSVTHLAPANDNVIGGLQEGAGNVISGGGAGGIALSGYVGASIRIVGNTKIQGNLIGFDASGTTPLPGQTGIMLDASGVWDTLVGGLTVAPAGNAVGAQQTGISLFFGINGGPHRTRIQGNLVRNAFFGIKGYPNAGTEITRNVIGPNTSSGIFLDGGTVPIRANSISGNGGLGIDLAPAGVTPNDQWDADTGPNGLQNYPVLTSAVSSGGSTIVNGMLSSAANAPYTIELFQSPAPHVTGYGEGAIFRTSLTVFTDGSGNAAIFAVLPAIPPGHVITATATDAAGNTSEFSAARVVTP